MGMIHNAKEVCEKASKLPIPVMVMAYELLFDEWGKKMSDNEKVSEMKAVFRGSMKPCVSFEGWIRCVEYVVASVDLMG